MKVTTHPLVLLHLNFSYGDFNGDGHEDVVVASYHVPRHLETIDAPDILVLLNDGHGRLLKIKLFLHLV